MTEHINHSRNAKITIEFDDYKVTMNGKLEPPMRITRWFEDIYKNSLNDYYDGTEPGLNITENIVNLKLVKAENILIERIKWEIPLSTKPRIEND